MLMSRPKHNHHSNHSAVDVIAYSCGSSRAGEVAGRRESRLPGDLPHALLNLCITDRLQCFVVIHIALFNPLSATTTVRQSGEAPFFTGEEPPPHSGELTHDLPQAGGPTQSQLSRPMSSRHHISTTEETSMLNETYECEVTLKSVAPCQKSNFHRRKSSLLQ